MTDKTATLDDGTQVTYIEDNFLHIGRNSFTLGNTSLEYGGLSQNLELWKVWVSDRSTNDHIGTLWFDDKSEALHFAGVGE